MRALRAVLLGLVLLACSSTPDPKTVAEARPELAFAYEVGFRAWVWLDSRNAALYDARAEVVQHTILQHRADFERECGEAAPQCMLAAFESLMAEWAKVTGYDERARHLEVAREGLAAMREFLASDPKGTALEWAPAVAKTVGALSVLVDDLKAHDVEIPDVVSVGLKALKALI